MLDLIILVLISLIVVSYFVADKKLENYFFDLDIIYFQFLEEEQQKIEIKMNIQKQIKLEQKIRYNNKVIKADKKHTKPVYIKGCGYISTYKDKPSSFDVWRSEGLNIRYKKEWKELRLNNQK